MSLPVQQGRASRPDLPAASGRSGLVGPDQKHQYLTFSLDQELFAVEILCIREIIEFGTITHVPMAPPFIRGVINLRGAVVPVIDLSVRFGRERMASTRRTCIVITEVESAGGTLTMGIVVDAVSEVLDVPESLIEPPPEFGSKIRTDFIKHMAKIDNRFVVILDINRVLSVEEVSVLAYFNQQGSASAN